jgi:hypothetical protein
LTSSARLFLTISAFVRYCLGRGAVVYENGRAYPQYLLRYYRGKYDPTRVKYKSRAEAPNSNSMSGGAQTKAALPKRAAPKVDNHLFAAPSAAPPSLPKQYFHIDPHTGPIKFNADDCKRIDGARKRCAGPSCSAAPCPPASRITQCLAGDQQAAVPIVRLCFCQQSASRFLCLLVSHHAVR